MQCSYIIIIYINKYNINSSCYLHRELENEGKNPHTKESKDDQAHQNYPVETALSESQAES